MRHLAIACALLLLTACANQTPKLYSQTNAEGYPLACDKMDDIKGGFFPSMDLSDVFNDIYQDAPNRKLAVFMDGTGNTDKTRSNVWILYTLAIEKACAGDPIIPYYEEGVGSQWYDRILGGATGKGVGLNIRRGYRFLASSYQPKDEIFIFGFSRGAFTARSLNGMVEYAGLLDPQSLQTHWYDFLPRFLGTSELHWTVEDIYDLYNVHNNGKPTFHQTLRDDIAKGLAKQNIQVLKTTPVVTAIGVFDTVPALGLSRKSSPDNHRLGLYAKAGFHAMSLDEQRYDFQVHRFHDPIKEDQHVEEVWFPGVHANVGGGYLNFTGLESLSRHWMLEKFKPYNLFAEEALNLSCKPHQAQCAGAHLNDEFFDNADVFKPFGIFRRTPDKGDTLHGSIACRLTIDPLLKPHPDREPNGVYVPMNLSFPLSDNYNIIDYDCIEGKLTAANQ